MMRRILLSVLFLTVLLSVQPAKAQFDSVNNFKTYRVGIFSPLYLDSVFSTAGNFRYKSTFPNFISPGLDFVHGAEIAIDSMALWNANIQASIYDSKSYTEPIGELIKNRKLDSLDLIIGSVKDAEYRQLADFALQKNIPFISATYPNDGGIADNPYVVLMTPTLRAHCEALYAYILQTQDNARIILCRQPGMQEDKVAGYFKAINEQEGKPMMNIQVLNFDSTISSYYLKTKLDSTKQNFIIGGSLDEEFAGKLATAVYNIPDQYHLTLLGMPNWDGFKTLTKNDDLNGLPIYFTTSYYNLKTDAFSKMLMSAYSKKYHGKPTDMAFKGFESTYLFSKLLTKYPETIMTNLNDKTFKLYCEYNFKPVSATNKNDIPDYFENKHLYIIKMQNGNSSKVW